MNAQVIAIKPIVIQIDKYPWLIRFIYKNQLFLYSNWILLRSTTINKIISGHIEQSDTPIINAFTLSNNISRRAMEFIATKQPQPPVENNEDANDDDAEDDNNNNEANLYNDDIDYNNNHVNYEDDDYAYDEWDDRYNLHSYDEDNYEYSHI